LAERKQERLSAALVRLGNFKPCVDGKISGNNERICCVAIIFKGLKINVYDVRRNGQFVQTSIYHKSIIWKAQYCDGFFEVFEE
jgi:hypothetical protein